jgi:hypothetical protein
MSIRNLLALVAIPICLSLLPVENRQFWFYLNDDQFYAEQVIYSDPDSIYIIAKNVGNQEAAFVDGLVGSLYYRETATGQTVKLESSAIVYPRTTALFKGATQLESSRLVKIGGLAPIAPNQLRLQTPAEEEMSIYLNIVVLLLVALLAYTIVLFDRQVSTEAVDT